MKLTHTFLIIVLAWASTAKAGDLRLIGQLVPDRQARDIVSETRAHGASCDVPHLPENPVTTDDYPGEPIKLDHSIAIWGQKQSKSLIYLPANKEGSTQKTFPLAIILHGRTFDYDQYTTIQTMLARNGIASTSIQYSETHDEKDYEDEDFYEVLEKNIQNIFNYSDIEPNPLYGKVLPSIALIGHSMGGGLVVYGANRLVKEGKYPIKLNSVINLAPNPQAGKEWYLEPGTAQGLLVLFGSNDADVNVNTQMNSGFYTYDQSGYLHNEFTNKNPKNAFTKSMVYLKGADHTAYVDSGPSEHLQTMAAYIAAYGRWSLLGDVGYRIYFKQQLPIDEKAVVSVQHSEAYRRVLENFESAQVAYNSLGGKNYFVNLKTEHDYSLFLDDNSPHYTNVLKLEWDANTSVPIATFSLPMAKKGGFTDYRDLSEFRYFSFRAGQRYNPAMNSEDLDFVIRITYVKDGKVFSQARSLSDFGQIPFPYAHKEASETKSAMNTILVPLCAFEKITFSQVLVTGISFEFTKPGSEVGALQIDSLEFTQ